MSTFCRGFGSSVSLPILCAISFLGGAGFLKPMLLFVAVVTPILYISYKEKFFIFFKFAGSSLGFIFLVIFLYFYWSNFTPYRPEVYNFYPSYFKVLFFYSVFFFMLLLFSASMAIGYLFIWWFCLGALFYASLTVLVSVCLIPEPYYGRLIDLRGFFLVPLVFSNNRPGISNLMCLFPAVWCAGLLLKPNDRPKKFLWIGLACFFVALIVQFYLQQRTFNIIIFVILPCMLLLIFLLKKEWIKFAGIAFFAALYPLAILIGDLFEVVPIERKLDAQLLIDPRVQMFKYWISHFISDPWSRPMVGPDSLASTIWFHNFFADINRLSGPIALFAAVAFCVYFFTRLSTLLKVNLAYGLPLTVLAVTTFAIMNTSVVPEGEMQPFVLLIMICAMVESFSCKRASA